MNQTQNYSNIKNEIALGLKTYREIMIMILIDDLITSAERKELILLAETSLCIFPKKL
jgi:hypothetical protein